MPIFCPFTIVIVFLQINHKDKLFLGALTSLNIIGDRIYMPTIKLVGPGMICLDQSSSYFVDIGTNSFPTGGYPMFSISVNRIDG